MRKLLLVAALLPLVSGGCVAKAAWNVATLPVRAVGAGADAMTTSSKERDEKWAHEQRKAQERREKDARAAAKHDRQRGVDRDL